MTLDSEVKEKLPKSSSRINGAAVVCMMIRKALERDDLFEEISEEVINDFIRRLEE